MSVHIKPCHGCPLGKGCQQRNEFRAKVAGLGLRSATFDCPILKEKLAPGTRIEIEVPRFVAYSRSDDYGYDRRGSYRVKATITSQNRAEFACVIDREYEDHISCGPNLHSPERIRFRKYRPHRQIKRFLDEPKRRMCGLGSPILSDGTCDRPEGEQCWCKQDQFKEAAE